MKKAAFLSLLFLPAFLFWVSPTLAQDNITTGNSTSETRVYNTVTGDGSVYTHIETTVNGKTNTIDSKNQGEIDVRNENGKVTVINSPGVTVAVSENESSTPTPEIIQEPKLKTPSLVSVVVKGIEDFFKRFFHTL
jgi:hypothetical protein